VGFDPEEDLTKELEHLFAGKNPRSASEGDIADSRAVEGMSEENVDTLLAKKRGL